MAELLTGTDSNGTQYEFRNGQWRQMDRARSTGENILLGAGEQFTSIGRGVQEIFGDSEAARAAQASEAEARQFLHKDAPIAAGVGNALPFLATAPLGAGALTARGVAGITGLEAGIGALEIGTPAERLRNAAFGGGGALLGLGVGRMADRVFRSLNQSGRAVAGGVDFADPNAAPLGDGGRVVPFEPIEGTGQFGRQSVGAGAIDDIQTQGDVNRELFGSFGGGKGSIVEDRGVLEALDDAEALGYVVPPGAASGSRGARIVGDTLTSNPFTGDVMQEVMHQTNRDLLEKDLLLALGEDASTASRGITRSSLSKIDRRLDAEMSDIYKNNKAMKLDEAIPQRVEGGAPVAKTIDDMLAEVSEGHRRAGRSRGAEDPVTANIDNIRNLIKEAGEGGSIPTQRVAEFRSTLRRFQRQANTADDANASETLGDAVNALDDWIEKSLGAGDSKRFHEALQEFRLMQSIDTPSVISAAGDLRPAAIDRQLRKNFKTEYARNNRFFEGGENVTGALGQDLDNLFRGVRVMNQFPAIIGDSGTASRSLVNSVITGDVAAGAAGLTRPFIRKFMKKQQPTKKQLDDAFNAFGDPEFSRHSRAQRR